MKQDLNTAIQDGLCTLISYAGIEPELTLPEGIERIGRNAFLKCHTLRSVVLPGSLTCIETEAFHCCDSLEEISFSEGLTEIQRRAFWYCSSLKHVCFPKSLQVIGSRAFECCTNLETITLQNPDTLVDEYAFNETAYWNRLLKASFQCTSRAEPGSCPASLLLPEGLTHIDVWYYSKSRVVSVYLPNSLRTLGMSAFQGCEHLKELSMSPNTYCNSRLTSSSAADGIFSGCSLLEQVTFRGPLKNFTWYDASAPELLRGFDPEKTFFGCHRLKRMIGWEIPLSCYPPGWQRYAVQGYLGDIDRKKHYLPEVAASYDRYLANMVPQLLRRTATDHSLALHQYLTENKLIDAGSFDTILSQAVRHGDADVISILLEYRHQFLKVRAFGTELLSGLQELDEL
ncbi:leucine-rich repeat domain-containing protein [Lacrimispora sp. 210928-DFI.3.58]|uniref:leucine-rich repeat domain-containing protein n=1 Tax=Lacrimispora sp. 210928-DFI.3.58 TaxID=2883214 RepID=UPI0015B5463F|nr:leucine-rich repeat domain-containing protein [Lacrimispora sp. 210928-DFI.3.58]MCB7320706.1 leucine-rich repeat domain-containing protein [Lacrimispora sp. 210928-DFI.3.58]